MRILGAPVSSETAAREVEDELKFHIELRTRDNIADGMSQEDALADAMKRFGDFDHIRGICEEIKKERLSSIMKVIKGFTYTMIGCGVTLKLIADVANLRDVGQFLILIAILWRLLIYLREIQPDQNRINSIEQPSLSVIHTIGNISSADLPDLSKPPLIQVPAYDKDGRTPVERLISGESPNETNR